MDATPACRPLALPGEHANPSDTREPLPSPPVERRVPETIPPRPLDSPLIVRTRGGGGIPSRPDTFFYRGVAGGADSGTGHGENGTARSRTALLNPLLRPVWGAAAAAARLAAALAPDADAKLIRSFRARRGVLSRIRDSARTRDPDRPLIWLHAPSVGEGLQARPVLEALRAAHPTAQLAYTWFSPSAERFARGLDVDLCEVLPFDGHREAEVLLAAWRPTVLAFVKLDVWPVLAERARAAGVRTALVSATLAPTSGRQGRLARALLHDAYAGLDAVGAISADDAARLAALGVPAGRIRVTGDTRMDQVWRRAAGVGPDHPVRGLVRDRAGAAGAAAPPEDLSSHGPVLVAGSTWPADEAVLLPAAARWLQATPGARLIIAPHEPTPAHLEPIERWAAREGIPIRRLPAVEGGADAIPWSVLLVDRVGVLGDLYALGDMAFVGGGFHGAGLHSVLEPAAFGLPVLFGPRHGNAREAGELVARGGAFVVTAAREIEALLADRAGGSAAGTAARGLVREGCGATERVVRMLGELVL